MNDEFGQSNSQGGAPEADLPLGAHLSPEELESLVGGRFESRRDRSEVDRHLSTCAACRSELADHRALRTMLRALPAPPLNRGFALGPEHLRQRATLLDRLSTWLVPALPALRTATVAIALLLVGISVRNALVDSSNTGPTQESRDAAPALANTVQPEPTIIVTIDQAALQTNQATEAVPANATEQPAAAQETSLDTSTVAPGDSDGGGQLPAPSSMFDVPTEAARAADEEGAASDAAPASDAAASSDEGDDAANAGSGSAGATSDVESAESGAAAKKPEDDNVSSAMAVPASPTATATPKATATATSTATALPSLTPTATATARPAPTPLPVSAVNADTGGGRSLWVWAQWALGILLVLAVFTHLVAQRARKG